MSLLPAGLALALRLLLALMGLCCLGPAALAVQDARQEWRRPPSLRSWFDLVADALLFAISLIICMAMWLVALI